MRTEIIQILLFCAIPLGIVLLIFSIKILKKVTSSPILLELPYERKTGTFKVNQSGKFSIWHKGKLFKKTPVAKFKPNIVDIKTGKEIKLRHSIFRQNMNGFKYGRMELFYFYAQVGDYRISLIKGSSVSKIEKYVSELIPTKSMDLNDYYIQIRKSVPFYRLILSVLMIIISGFLIIGGFVMGLLSKQIFN